MPIVRFFETSIANPGGTPPFRDGIRAEIVIDSKSNLHYEFPAMNEGETPHTVLARAPHEIRINFADKLLSYLAGQLGISGTPLDAVTAISRAQAENLRSAGIHTVEDLVQAPEPVLEHMGAAGARLRQIGKTYMDQIQGHSSTAELSRLQQQNEELRAQMQEMQSTFLQMLEDMKAEQTQGGSREQTQGAEGAELATESPAVASARRSKKPEAA